MYADTEQSEAPDSENGISEFIPVFSKLLIAPEKPSQPSATEDDLSTSDEPYESDLIPALSLLKQSAITEDSELIPDFNMLMSSNESSKSSTSNPSSAKCSSPLPNLSLNTQLPHFTYAQLEVATDNFSAAKENGRFLGAGAFGSVFLATGLLDKPVAVKKIFLENVEMVSEGDQVTKQFKNEVEVLYKYNHDNLVSLLGYSCDGCTYCLIYEYVPGGSLFDALQVNSAGLPIIRKNNADILIETFANTAVEATSENCFGNSQGGSLLAYGVLHAFDTQRHQVGKYSFGWRQ